MEVTARCGVMGNNLYRLVSPNTWTDENGRFSLPVDFPDISYNVTFRYRYGSRREMKIIPIETGQLQVQLAIKTSQIVRGQVVNGSDLSPVSGATIRYFGEYQKFVIERITDENGLFEITELPLSEFQGVIYAQLNEQVSPATMVRYRNAKKPVNVKLKLKDGAELRGIVKSELTDEPIENCTVSVTTPYMSGYSMQTTTDSNGLYMFHDLPPAEYKITAQNQNYFKYEKNSHSLNNEIKLSSGQYFQKDLTLKKRMTFTGKVFDFHGEPVLGAIVAIDEAHVSDNKYSPFVVHTDENGNFSITTGRIDTKPAPKLTEIDTIVHKTGEDAIEAFSSTAGYGRFRFSPYREGNVVKQVEIKLNGMIRVHGKVTDPNGNPVPEVKIYDNTGFEASSQTDKQGEFDLGIIPIRWPEKDQGSITFLAPRPEGNQVINQRTAIIKNSESENVEVGFLHHKQLHYSIEPGNDIELNVVLEPTELITLKGTVLYDSGLPAEGADITLFIGNADPNTWLQTLHPDVSSFSIITPINDRDICKTKTDNNGFWKITTTRETKEGIKLSYWSNKDPNLFSIGIETPDKQTTLIQDIILDNNITKREIDVKLSDKNEKPLIKIHR